MLGLKRMPMSQPLLGVCRCALDTWPNQRGSSAQDGCLTAQQQVAYEGLSGAQILLSDEDFEGALQRAQATLDACREQGEEEAAIDSAYVVVKALAGQGKRKDANGVAKDELARCQQSGHKRGQGMMLLGMAEAQFGKETSSIKIVEEARSLFREAGGIIFEVAALLTLARLHMQRDRDGTPLSTGKALQAAAAARDICKTLPHRRGEAEACHIIAAAHAENRNFDACFQAAEEALDAYLELKDKRMEACEVHSMAKWNMKAGRPEKAIPDAEDAIGIYQISGSPKEFDAVATLFDALLGCGESHSARLVAAEAIGRLQRGSKCKKTEAHLMKLLVDLAYREAEVEVGETPGARGKCEEALGLAERCVELLRDTQDPAGESRVLVTLSALYFLLERFDDAVKAGEQARALLQVSEETGLRGDTGQQSLVMPDLFFTLAGSQLNHGAHDEALKVAMKMRDYFRRLGDARREASALLTVSSTQLLLGSLDQAAIAAKRARMLFTEENDPGGRGTAMRLLLEVHWRKSEFRPAIQVAERACACFREAGDRHGEARMLYSLAQNATSVAAEEGAVIGHSPDAPPNLTRSASEALAKAHQAAGSAAELCRSLISDGTSCVPLLASSLAALASVQALQGDPEESLASADEAMVLFRDCGDACSEGSVLIQSAEALRMLHRHDEALEAAEEAVGLCSTHGDENGAARARQLVIACQSAMRLIGGAARLPQQCAAAPGASGI